MQDGNHLRVYKVHEICDEGRKGGQEISHLNPAYSFFTQLEHALRSGTTKHEEHNTPANHHRPCAATKTPQTWGRLPETLSPRLQSYRITQVYPKTTAPIHEPFCERPIATFFQHLRPNTETAPSGALHRIYWVCPHGSWRDDVLEQLDLCEVVRHGGAEGQGRFVAGAVWRGGENIQGHMDDKLWKLLGSRDVGSGQVPNSKVQRLSRW